MAVFAPVQHIRALGQEDVTERCVAAVAWTGQHHEVAVDFSREENGISVEWKEWILHTYEGFKIFCFCHSDGCTVEVLAPDDVVGIFYFYKTRVICVNRHERFAFFVNELDFVLIEIPVDRIFASSKVDVGATGITAGLYNMAAKGQKLYIVADKGREEKGYSSSALLASSAEYDNGLTSIEALKGKRVGITQKGSTFHYMLGRMLESKGLTLDDVTIVPLGKLSAVMAALQSGQIDACILNEPNITKVKNEGYGKEITQVSAVMPYQTSGIFYSPEFAKNKDAAVRFMKAYNKACNEYYNAVVDKKDPAKLDEVVKIIAKYVKTPEADIRLGLPYVDKNGVLMADDIKTQIDWYSSHGMIDGKLDAKDVVNTSFLEEAMKK